MTKASQQNKTLLVIEDEELLLNILVDEFASEGFRVLHASDGQEGLDLALREHPDLILLDILMPHMDGMGFLQKLRADEWGNGAAVLILTNIEGDVKKTIEAMENGVFEYLVKSRWSLEEIKERVREKLKGQDSK